MKSKVPLPLLIVMIIASLIGYVVENVWILFRHGYIDNRGMFLPFLLGYGLTCVFMYVNFGVPGNPKFFTREIKRQNISQAVYICSIFVCILVGESCLGYAVEYLTHIRWWDYSAIPLHIGRYTSIPTSLGFTFGVYLFMDKIFPIFYSIGVKYANLCSTSIVHIILLLMSVDCIHAFIYMFHTQSTLKLWRIYLPIKLLFTSGFVG